MPIKILVVEDNLLTRIGVTTLLEGQPDFQIVGQAADGAEGVTRYRTLHPDIVVTDLRMPGFDGLSLVQALVREKPPARILVVTHYDGEENIFRAISAGALGYVTKDAAADSLFEGIRTVARGDRFLPAELAAKFVARSMSKGLSRREQQVLELLHGGLSNKEIAQRLGIADKTIQLYVAAVLNKLGASTRTEAVFIALERGLLMPARQGG
ncbi:MAG: response regulator transcription factor [Deltaproteobacteria bacterium]|nr:response regulator transcription factor [Deltaproteobacteria bacterium]